jgi:hypothetical protein
VKLGLSCGHVIARFWHAHPGERVLVPSYENIVANGYPETPFGALVTVLPIGFQTSDAIQNVDAATFQPDSPSDLDEALAILGVPPVGVRGNVSHGLRVRKVGYATELTYSVVQAVNALIRLSYPHPLAEVLEMRSSPTRSE